MGTSANENIAIGVTTTADLSGLKSARAETTALGTETKRVADQVVAATASAAKGEETLATAATKATTETGKLVVSAEAMASALARTGGDLQKAAQLAAAETRAAQGLAAGATEVAAAATQAAASTTELATSATKATAAETSLTGSLIAALEKATAATTALEKTTAATTTLGATATKTAAVQTTAVKKVASETKQGTQAIIALSNAAATGTGSVTAMANAVGNLATGLASVSKNARIAAGASALGLIITVGAAAYGIFKSYTDKTEELGEKLKDLQSEGRGLGAALGGDDLRGKIEQINRAADKEILALKEINFHGEQRKAIEAQLNANRTRSIDLANTQFQNEQKARSAERETQITVGRSGLALEQERLTAKRNDLQLSLQANEAERTQRAQEIAQSFVRRSASGEIVKLTAEEVRQRQILLDLNDAQARALGEQLRNENILAVRAAEASRLQGSENLGDRFRGRLEEIELERAAEIQALGDVEGATLNSEQKIRALRRETARQASTDAKTIFDAFRSSSNASLKAIGAFGENLRRIAIGAEAARAAVRAAVETGEAIASFAVGDFAGGALHGAAALQLGAAAALGFRESLGGGGGGGAGGGGGGLGFRPKESGGGGNVTIILQTVDPNSRENIRNVSYHLQRQGILKVPIYPTTGLIGGTA